MSKKILITGGAGFIGAHLVHYWLKNHPEDYVLCLDKLTYAACLENLESVHGNDHYEFAQVDLADRAQVRGAILRFGPNGVLHLAAESHVDNSIQNGEPFVQSNIVGTFNLLEECRLFWGDERHRFLHVSTDEVYGSLGDGGTFSESSPYQPSSPYSASKAASDHLVGAYQRTYGMNTVVTHCGNNYGPYQHAEKLIPTVIRLALGQQEIPIFGSGNQVRDWLFVGDHCVGLDKAFSLGKAGRCYNFGARNEHRNKDLVFTVCSILDRMAPASAPDRGYFSLARFVSDRPGHDWRYSIDPSRAEQELGWRANSDFYEKLQETVLWYLSKRP